MEAKSSRPMNIRSLMVISTGAMAVLSVLLIAKRMVLSSVAAHWWWNFYVEVGIGFASTFRYLPVFIEEDVAS